MPIKASIATKIAKPYSTGAAAPTVVVTVSVAMLLTTQ
jgi:hypothetical protein